MMQINMIETGRNIRKMRNSRNLGIAETASACGVSTIAVYLWEEGKKLPSLDHVVDMMNAFECGFNDLVAREG